MSDKDSQVVTILTRLGLVKDPELTPEQEEQLQTALDPELQRLKDIENVFTPKK